MNKQKQQGQSLINGAMFLMVTTVIVHVVGVIYKIPLTRIIGTVGRGYFTSAYEIYTPIYAISMAGLPVAVSKMVAENMATGRYRDVIAIRKASIKIFLITGIAGTAFLMLFAYPYTHLKFFINTPEAFWSVMFIAPSIFFCCMMASYMGYYEGLRNMTPTGVSQMFEIFGKLLFGLFMAKEVYMKGIAEFNATGMVYDIPCADINEAQTALAPYTAAAAISGVTFGTVIGLIYLMIRHKVKGDGITKEMLLSSPEPSDSKSIGRALIRFAIPVVTSSLVLNITNLIDTWTIQNRLSHAVMNNGAVIKGMYAAELMKDHVPDDKIKDFLYGCYGVSMDFRNIIPSVIMTLGVSALPVLSGAWATRNRKKMGSTISLVLKTTNLIAIPAGLVMGFLAEPVVRILYAGSKTESSIPIASPFVAIYGFFALILAVSTPVTNMLQAIGRADVPVKTLLVGSVVKFLFNFILVGMPSVNIKGAPVGTILCYIIIVFLNLYVLIKETGVRINWYKVFIKPLAAGGLAGLSSKLIYEIFVRILPEGAPGSRNAGFTYATIIAIIGAIIIWLILLVAFKVLTRRDILQLPGGQKLASKMEKRGLLPPARVKKNKNT